MNKIDKMRSFAFEIKYPDREGCDGLLDDMAYNLALEVEAIIGILNDLCVGYKEALDGDYDRVNLALERLDEWNNSNGK